MVVDIIRAGPHQSQAVITRRVTPLSAAREEHDGRTLSWRV